MLIGVLHFFLSKLRWKRRPMSFVLLDEAHARVCRRIHDRFTLMKHGDRIAGQ